MLFRSKERYKEWCVQLQELSSLTIPRCIKPHNFNVSSIEFHHFADASTSGYGVCSYVRFIDHNGSVSVSLVYAKSRVSPIKPVTIPRLELTAAVLAVRCSVMLEREFKFECPVKHFFYSDSTVVLGYISNSTRRYQLFVANRVGVIQSLTSVSQWSHVAGKQNPADLASRGCLPTVHHPKNVNIDGRFQFISMPNIGLYFHGRSFYRGSYLHVVAIFRLQPKDVAKV